MALSRASRGWVLAVVITPDSITVTTPGAASMTPNPVATRPGSSPMTRRALGRGDGVEDLVRDVVVGVDRLDVVLLFEGLDEPQHGGGVLALHADGGLGNHGRLRFKYGDPLVLEGGAHRLHFIRRGGDLKDFFHRAHVGGARFQRLLEHLILLHLLRVDLNNASTIEHPGDTARGAHTAALLLEDVPDLGPRAVLVVGEDAHEHGDAARAVALVRDLLELFARTAPRTFLDGALDVVRGHVGGLGRLHSGLEPHVGLGIAPAVLGRHRDLSEDLREELPPLHVRLALLPLDLGPPSRSRHTAPFLLEWML